MNVHIPDVLLEHVWVPDPEIGSLDGDGIEENRPVKIGPDFYQQNGTPIDYDGNDMVYSHSECEVFGKALDLLISARPHVPRDLSAAIGELLEEVVCAMDARETA